MKHKKNAAIHFEVTDVCKNERKGTFAQSKYKKKKMTKTSLTVHDDQRTNNDADQHVINPVKLSKSQKRKMKLKLKKNIASMKPNELVYQIGDASSVSLSNESSHIHYPHESRSENKNAKLPKNKKMGNSKDRKTGREEDCVEELKKKSKNKLQQNITAERPSINQCTDKGIGEIHQEGEKSTKNKLDYQIKSKKRKFNGDKASLTTESNIMPSKKSRRKKIFNKPSLDDMGFLWDLKLEDFDKLNETQEESKNDEDEDDEQLGKSKKKKTKGERLQEMKDEEARLRLVEQTLLEAENNPKTADQFDRALLAKPDDSDLWIKYIAHHLQATEIDKGRAVARRALQTINQRLEMERLNVWIALLNLENMFGTQESLKSILDEALRTNDELTVYSKMLNIYTESKKSQETEQLVSVMLRKFRTSPKCWLDCCAALMNINLPDKARNHVQRAISALPNKEHLNLLCKFALVENQHGFSDQSQTLFEHILTSYPKRTDIWNVYVDMLVKSNKIAVARQILERACRQKLPPRNMKMLFSKWISFEEKHGNPEKVEHVRKQAEAYVGQLTKKLE